MGNVLRKKVDAAAGLPPSLVACDPFWRHILSKTNSWADEALGGEAFFALEKRRVCRGSVISRLLSKHQVAYFNLLNSPGFTALAVDMGTLSDLSARRLGVEANELGAAPLMLKRLLFGKVAAQFWSTLAPIFPEHDERSACEPYLSSENGGDIFPADETFVLVNLASGEVGAGPVISVVLPLEYLMNNLEQLPACEVNNRRTGTAQAPGLEAIALDTRIEMDAVVGELQLPLANWFHMDVGEIHVLVEAKDREAALEVGGSNGRTKIGTGTMGVLNDRRAIRVNAMARGEHIQSSLISNLTEQSFETEEVAQ